MAFAAAPRLAARVARRVGGAGAPLAAISTGGHCLGSRSRGPLPSAGAGARRLAAAAGGPEAPAKPAAPKRGLPITYEVDTDWRQYLPETWMVKLWSQAKQWYTRRLGTRRYPQELTICNSGADFGVTIPRPDLVLREGLERESPEWRMQLYGAALYWHLATTPGKDQRGTDPNMLRGKDVLEVACMRGGGARFLAEAAGPQRYVAVDAAEDHVEMCTRRHPPLEGLSFERADLCSLRGRFPASSFDVVLCVEPGHLLQDVQGFIDGVSHVLRPGGRLLLCDALPSDGLQSLLNCAEASDLTFDVCDDMSKAVVVAGVSSVPGGHLYLRLVASKEPTASTE